MKSINKVSIKAFQKKILNWYKKNKRDLPWRDVPFGTSFQEVLKGVDLDERAYRILVSEVMLQQTQVSRVIPKYENWLKLFPTISDLANAPRSEVLRAWSGLGYNRRAIFLQKLAQVVVEKYDGKFPREEKELLKLPGIGEYTARALLCFAFDEQMAVVDTNIRKVIITQFVKNSKSQKSNPKQISNSNYQNAKQTKVTNKQIQDVAEKLLPKGRAYDWNQALMDYATAVLKKERIPIPRQSKFKGSRRYYRGQIVKQLLQEGSVTVADLGKLIKKDFSDNERDWLSELLGELELEGFVKVGEKEVKLV